MQVRLPRAVGLPVDYTVQVMLTAAQEVGVRLENLRTKGRTVSFVLRPPVHQPNRWQRVSASAFGVRQDGERRRIAAICWHGHRAFFRAAYRIDSRFIFTTHPMSTVRNDACYRNAEHFEAVHHLSDTNIGSQAYPMLASKACVCPERDDG